MVHLDLTGTRKWCQVFRSDLFEKVPEFHLASFAIREVLWVSGRDEPGAAKGGDLLAVNVAPHLVVLADDVGNQRVAGAGVVEDWVCDELRSHAGSLLVVVVGKRTVHVGMCTWVRNGGGPAARRVAEPGATGPVATKPLAVGLLW